MTKDATPAPSIKGKQYHAPRLTAAGYGALILYVALPFLGALALLDSALFLFFHYALNSCYGLWCL